MMQPSRTQGKVWQAALSSQDLSIIWEDNDFSVMQTLSELRQSAQVLPDLLLVDLALEGMNSYALCRWCRDHCPNIQVILTNSQRENISESELRWAIHQGAADLFPKFLDPEFAIKVTHAIKRVLEVLDCPALNQDGLAQILHLLTKPQPVAIANSNRSDDTLPLLQKVSKAKTALRYRGSTH